jgi:GT2 family glycosyltransferase
MNDSLSSDPGLVGVVTVLYNSDSVLPDFMASLASQTGVRFRLYAVDNSARDSGSLCARALAEQHNIDARVVFNNANVGVAKGNNQGIAMARSDGCRFILLSNNDTVFAPQTLKRLLDEMVLAGDSATAPKIMYHGEPSRIWYGGGRISAWTARVPHDGLDLTDRGQCDRQRRVGYAPTCFLLVDATVFDTVGVMDETYFVYYDDTDFAWRMGAKGLHVLYVPEVVVLHKVSTSTGGSSSAFTLYYTNRNRVYFIRKHLRGLRRWFALSYMLMTRLPRLGLLPRELAARGWSGVVDGWRMPLPKAEASR